MQSIESIYRYADNLSHFVHPLTNKRYRYMTDAEALSLAEEMVRAIAATGIMQVVVSETGASPLAEICSHIAAKHNIELHFLSVKFPRAAVTNITPVLLHYLTETEKSYALDSTQLADINQTARAKAESKPGLSLGTTRQKALEAICAQMPPDFFRKTPMKPSDQLLDLATGVQSQFQQSLARLLAGTSMASRMAQPFIYLDEYIDSGTTFGNAIAFFRCFTPALRFQVASYYLNADNELSLPHIAYTRFRGDDRPDCYLSGAYPFENRLDLIGHYYTITNKLCVRTTVESLQTDIRTTIATGASDGVTRFINGLIEFVDSNNLILWIKARCQIAQVASFIDTNQIIRYLIWSLEDRLGNEVQAEFLFQLFDMNGPAWSPMPTDFHFDFWQAFQPLAAVFREHQLHAQLADNYSLVRSAIIAECANICIQSRVSWICRVTSLLEERHVDCANRCKSLELPLCSV